MRMLSRWRHAPGFCIYTRLVCLFYEMCILLKSETKIHENNNTVLQLVCFFFAISNELVLYMVHRLINYIESRVALCQNSVVIFWRYRNFLKILIFTILSRKKTLSQQQNFIVSIKRALTIVSRLKFVISEKKPTKFGKKPIRFEQNFVFSFKTYICAQRFPLNKKQK